MIAPLGKAMTSERHYQSFVVAKTMEGGGGVKTRKTASGVSTQTVYDSGAAIQVVARIDCNNKKCRKI